MNEHKHILENVSSYYSNKIKEFGAVPRGVDWNSSESQITRFQQLSKIIIDKKKSFTINDFGCGYGDYYGFLERTYLNFDYEGIDISSDMVDLAKKRISKTNCSFRCSDKNSRIASYTVASGVLNVKQECSNESWWEYFVETLDLLDRSSSDGFAFNCLTSFSDKDKMKDYLYYADPMRVFRHCKENYSRNVALLHDYDLYEFTILVRK